MRSSCVTAGHSLSPLPDKSFPLISMKWRRRYTSKVSNIQTLCVTMFISCTSRLPLERNYPNRSLKRIAVILLILAPFPDETLVKVAIASFANVHNTPNIFYGIASKQDHIRCRRIPLKSLIGATSWSRISTTIRTGRSFTRRQLCKLAPRI